MGDPIYIWQGFQHRWLNHPHRVGALASFCDPRTGAVTQGFFPGQDGDNGTLATGVARLDPADLAIEARLVELTIEGFDTPNGRADRSWEAELRGRAESVIEGIAEGHEVHAVLAGFGWFPTEGPKLAPRQRRAFLTEGLARVWPVELTLGLRVEAGAEASQRRVVAEVSLTHADAADILKKPRHVALWHEVRVAVLVLVAAPTALVVEDCACSWVGTTPTQQGPAVDTLDRAAPPGWQTIIGLQGMSLRIGDTARTPRGRYLHELAFRVKPKGASSIAPSSWEVRYGVRGNGSLSRRRPHRMEATVQLLELATPATVAHGLDVRERQRVSTGLVLFTAPCPPPQPFHRIGWNQPTIFREGEAVTDLRASSFG